MFEKIKEHMSNLNLPFNPKYFHLDFHLGQYRAVLETFDDSVIIFCFFHFVQAQKRYLNDKKNGNFSSSEI